MEIDSPSPPQRHRHTAEQGHGHGHGHGDRLSEDIVSNIVSRLFTLDLLAASLVSTTWLAAVKDHRRCTAAARRPPPPPWLLLRLQGRHTRSNSAAAFDPSSRSWRLLPNAFPDPFPQSMRPIPISAALGRGARLHALAAPEIALSNDPLAATWHRLDVPAWTDVKAFAVAGPCAVALGITDANDDDGPATAVARRVLGSNEWEACDAMPEVIAMSPAISVAVAGDEGLWVVENQPPRWACRLDLVARIWTAPFRLELPDRTVNRSAVGFVAGRLVAVGATARDVRFWAVEEETMEVVEEMEGWRMPPEMAAEVVGGNAGRRWQSLGFLSEGQFGYLHDASDSETKVVFLFEFREGESWWQRVAAPPEVVAQFKMHRAVVGCSTLSRDIGLQWNQIE